jgi:hypothetical protein
MSTTTVVVTNVATGARDVAGNPLVTFTIRLRTRP